MESNNKDYSFKGKWSKKIEEYGFTQVPNLLICCQGHLRLKDGELITLIQLWKHKFHENSDVYPSISSLAAYSGKNFKTIQPRLKKLEDKGFILRHQRYYTSNVYDLTPCVFKLAEHERICTDLPKKQVDQVVDIRTLDFSFLSSKEDKGLRRQNIIDIGNSTSTNSGPYPNVTVI